jgi:DNA modification methylase
MKVLNGDCIQMLKTLPSKSVHCCITSPPYYGLRSYCPDRMVLRDDAPLWVIEELKKRGILPIENEHDQKK